MTWEQTQGDGGDRGGDLSALGMDSSHVKQARG